MEITLKVSRNVLNFIREGLFNYYEELDNRLLEAEEDLIESLPDALKPIDQFQEDNKKYNYAWKPVAPKEVPKKPHWTQTAKGKKIMANRKPRGKAK